MGLKNKFKSKSGLEITNAYFKIVDIGVHVRQKTANVYLLIFADKEKRDAGFETLEPINYSFKGKDYEAIINGGNIVESMYNHLKTLPEFDGSVDV